ncbi:MAG: hypothetical protein J0M04_14240 [Verrucomicrobia bacterium]|nr:hypothetical protein [Verrucomicrobiota bacterium]
MPRHVRAVVLLFVLAGGARGMEIRDYSASRHNRFTGFPENPVWNDAAWFDSRKFTGVGWCPADDTNKRQFALVSPQHIVCVTHYAPGAGSVIRFLNADGLTVERTVDSSTAIQNDLGQNTDLSLAKFTTPLAVGDKVDAFPYLDLADENAYLNTRLTVFGWQAKAARGFIAAFDDLEGDGLNLTRALRFDYPIDYGWQDDCYLQSGDSGSPSFASVDGSPALVSVHTAIDTITGYRRNYDTFVCHYIAKLNLLMAADGYQMTPTAPPPTSLATAVVRTPEPWRQAMPATCRLDLTNTGASVATNPNAVLRFTPAQSPDTLDAPGWTVTNGAAGEFLLHRANLPAGETSSLTATWPQTGIAGQLPIRLDCWADGIAVRSYDFTTGLIPSYEAWADGLAQPAADADGDGDGLPNLLEYVFGGDPAVASRFQPGGVPLQPQVSAVSGTVSVDFPVREDAEDRGITYVVEFSTTLENGSWSADPPPGFSVEEETYTPDSPGFVRRTVTFDATAPRRFCRVRVELDEDG